MPRQTAYQLERYARKHPEVDLQLMEIPQIPGYRRESGRSKSVAGSLVASGDVIPLALLDPYVAAGVLADYLIFGRYPLVRKHPQALSPDSLSVLAGTTFENIAKKAPGAEAIEANAAHQARR